MCAECDVFPTDTLSKCATLSPPPLLPPSWPSREKRSSDNGTSSCSPIRNWCARQALEGKKPQMISATQPVKLSDTIIFLSAAKLTLLFRCPCHYKLMQ